MKKLRCDHHRLACASNYCLNTKTYNVLAGVLILGLSLSGMAAAGQQRDGEFSNHLILSGPGKGNLLVANADGRVVGIENPLTNFSFGTIGRHEGGCGCGDHFHGVLSGEDEPPDADDCGWGCTAKLSDEPRNVQDRRTKFKIMCSNFERWQIGKKPLLVETTRWANALQADLLRELRKGPAERLSDAIAYFASFLHDVKIYEDVLESDPDRAEHLEDFLEVHKRLLTQSVERFLEAQ